MFRFVINGRRGTKNILISLGLTLIVISMLVFLYPTFFAYFFAGVVGLIGLFILFNALFSKPRDTNMGPFGPGGGYNPGATEDGAYQELNDND